MNNYNHWDSYGVYAIATYLQNQLPSDLFLDLDTTWEVSMRLYNQFTQSDFNNENESELDCIYAYLRNNFESIKNNLLN